MATEQNFQEIASQFESDRDVPLQHNWKSISTPAATSENSNACFDCNICLDSAHDPVVTLCGHLYCWPCIYKWIHVQSSSPELENQPQCPICKANISHSSLVPLYGRGTSTSESEAKKSQLGLAIPRRPACLITNTTTSTSNPSLEYHQPNDLQSHLPEPYRRFASMQYQPNNLHSQYLPEPYGRFASMPSSSPIGNAVMTSFFNPMIGMFGEMAFARMFGGSETSLYAYPYPNTFHPLMETTTSRSRMTRQEMQLHKSLNRVSIFLFCCFILCFLLF